MLPPEIIQQVDEYLDIISRFTFGKTSKHIRQAIQESINRRKEYLCVFDKEQYFHAYRVNGFLYTRVNFWYNNMYNYCEYDEKDVLYIQYKLGDTAHFFVTNFELFFTNADACGQPYEMLIRKTDVQAVTKFSDPANIEMLCFDRQNMMLAVKYEDEVYEYIENISKIYIDRDTISYKIGDNDSIVTLNYPHRLGDFELGKCGYDRVIYNPDTNIVVSRDCGYHPYISILIPKFAKYFRAK